MLFEDLKARPVYPHNLRPGMLVRIRCYSDCVFPIRGVDAGLMSLEAACGLEVSGEWGVFCGPHESFIGMVVKVHHPERGDVNPVVEVLLQEHIVLIDELVMQQDPYLTERGTWRMVELT